MDAYSQNAETQSRLVSWFGGVAIAGYLFAILMFLTFLNLEAVYIMSSFAVWLLIMFLVFKHFFVHILKDVEDDDSRMTLSYIAGGWAIFSIIVFSVFQFIDKDSKPDATVEIGKSFYKVGYSHQNLVVFGIFVNTWWKYTLILIYQFTRSTIGAILANFFFPWITNTIRNVNGADIKLKRGGKDLVTMYSFSQFCAQVFWYVSSVTDVFFALSQIDFLVMRWAVDATVNWASTTFFVTKRLRETHVPNITPLKFGKGIVM